MRDFPNESLDHFNAVPALRSFAPRFDKRAVVVVVDRVLHLQRRQILDRAFDTALSRVAVPETVVEPELHFLFDIPGKIVRCDP